MKTVNVTGGTVTLREREDLTVRQRDRMQKMLMDVIPVLQTLPYDESGELDSDAIEKGVLDGAVGKEAIEAMTTLTRVMLVVRIAEWTLPGTPPQTIDEIDDLRAVLYDELAEHVSEGLDELMGAIDFQPSNPAAPGFDDTPTLGSAGSASV